MRVPIAYALSYPDRLEAPKEEPGLDLTALGEGMTFYKLDRDVFRTVDLAYEACRRGGSCPVALNGANEILVEMFLSGKIRFVDIQDMLVRVMEEHVPKYHMDIEGILEEDMKIRDKMRKMI